MENELQNEILERLGQTEYWIERGKGRSPSITKQTQGLKNQHTILKVLELIIMKPVNNHNDLAIAVLTYDKAIQSCANDPLKMASFCSAKGDTLDALYNDMLKKAEKENK